jgi:hypothetical protein
MIDTHEEKKGIFREMVCVIHLARRLVEEHQSGENVIVRQMKHNSGQGTPEA